MKEKNQIVLKFIIFVLVIIFLSVLLWQPLTKLFSSQSNLREFILRFNFLAPLILIALISLQMLISPLPGQIIGLVSGYLFGIVLGTIYSMTGIILGSYIAFLLSRRYGRPFVEKIVKKKTMEKFDRIADKAGPFTLFLIYLLPLFPDDTICYIAGLTKIKIRILVIICALGRLPGLFVLNLVGNGVATSNLIFPLLFFGGAMVVSLLIYFYRDYLEKIILGVVRKKKK